MTPAPWQGSGARRGSATLGRMAQTTFGPGDEAVAIDPVCAMEVVIATSRHTTEYHGETYHFCGKGCRLEFEDDPEKYLDPDYVPSM